MENWSKEKRDIYATVNFCKWFLISPPPRCFVCKIHFLLKAEHMFLVHASKCLRLATRAS